METISDTSKRAKTEARYNDSNMGWEMYYFWEPLCCVALFTEQREAKNEILSIPLPIFCASVKTKAIFPIYHTDYFIIILTLD